MEKQFPQHLSGRYGGIRSLRIVKALLVRSTTLVSSISQTSQCKVVDMISIGLWNYEENTAPSLIAVT